MRSLLGIALLTALAACGPAGQPGAPAPAASAAQACTLAGTWRIDSVHGSETWTILSDGTANNAANMIMKGQASLTDDRLVINFTHGDWAGVIGLTLAPGCQAGEGTYQYTAVPRGRQLEPAMSVTAARVPPR